MGRSSRVTRWLSARPLAIVVQFLPWPNSPWTKTTARPGLAQRCATRALVAAAVFGHPAIPSDVPSVPPLTVPGDEGESHAGTTAPQPRTTSRRTTTTGEADDDAPHRARRKKPAPETADRRPGGAGVGARRPVPRAGARRASGTPACRRTSGWAAELPPELAPYDPPPYTLERFLEDELNEKPRPLPMARPMTPRDQQCDGADVVAAHAAAGGRVFLLGDDPGVGKTGTAILAVKAIAEQRDVRTVLVVADRPAAITIPHWTRSIAGFGDGGLRWCVTTWDRLAKVSEAAVRRRRRRRGAHGAAHDDAAVEALEGRLRRRPGQGRARTCSPRPRRRRTPRSSCPTWRRSSPSATASRIREWADLPKRLAAHGFHVERGRYGWQWTEDADERRADLARLQGWLADADPPATLHRPAPWGPVSVTGHPGRADAGRAGRLRVGVVGVPRGDAAGPARRGRARRAGPRCCGSGRRPG